MSSRKAAIIGLFLVLAFDVWWRCHTISGTIRERIGFAPWPVVAESEPLDCDEALYAYMGKRIVTGDVIYRDLTEFKPPLGYWLYALAVRFGGPNELCIRLMPIPFIVATISLIWWIALHISGPASAVFSAFLYAIMSTDPYVYANGANMEHFINFFATTSLAISIRYWNSKKSWPWIITGILIAAASLVKQVAVLPLIPLAIGLSLRKSRTFKCKILDIVYLILGFSLIWACAFGVLLLQGAARQAFEDIFRYGAALASETPADRLQYSFLVRWIVGNTDPVGILPWPFGKTDGRAWWATGLWPIWLVSIPTIVSGILNRETTRRLTAIWILTSWIEVALPGLFWQHYYMLVLPGMAVLIGVSVSDSISSIRNSTRMRTALLNGIVCFTLILATVASVVIQVHEYLLVTPDLITTRYKGGGQWVVLRQLGRDLGKRSEQFDSARLFIWGIHSPLLFYSTLDSVTPQIFADPLMLADAQHLIKNNPRVEKLLTPRKQRTVVDLIKSRPEMIFLGAPPFPELEAIINSNYRQMRNYLPGLYLRKDLTGL